MAGGEGWRDPLFGKRTSETGVARALKSRYWFVDACVPRRGMATRDTPRPTGSDRRYVRVYAPVSGSVEGGPTW